MSCFSSSPWTHSVFASVPAHDGVCPLSWIVREAALTHPVHLHLSVTGISISHHLLQSSEKHTLMTSSGAKTSLLYFTVCLLTFCSSWNYWDGFMRKDIHALNDYCLCFSNQNRSLASLLVINTNSERAMCHRLSQLTLVLLWFRLLNLHITEIYFSPRIKEKKNIMDKFFCSQLFFKFYLKWPQWERW